MSRRRISMNGLPSKVGDVEKLSERGYKDLGDTDEEADKEKKLFAASRGSRMRTARANAVKNRSGEDWDNRTENCQIILWKERRTTPKGTAYWAKDDQPLRLAKRKGEMDGKGSKRISNTARHLRIKVLPTTPGGLRKPCKKEIKTQGAGTEKGVTGLKGVRRSLRVEVGSDIPLKSISKRATRKVRTSEEQTEEKARGGKGEGSLSTARSSPGGSENKNRHSAKREAEPQHPVGRDGTGGQKNKEHRKKKMERV